MAHESFPRVLVIDDDAAICRDYARLLRRYQLGVETATDGWQALLQVLPGAFDAVLTDVGMPGLDGVSLLRAIRDRDPELPVVLMSGAPSLESAVKAVEYGANQYLLKPVDPEALAEAVWRAVDLRRTRRERAERAAAGELQQPRCAQNAQLDVAIGTLGMAFQPIVSFPDPKVFAYEALARPVSGITTPDALFSVAERLGRSHELGRSVRRLVAEAAALAPPGCLLFVNVHADELNDNELLSCSAPLSGIAERVVLELTERAALRGVAGISTRLSRLRNLGFRLAIDDLGEGYAGLNGVIRLQPDFVKLDMSLVQGIDRSQRQRSLVRAITRVCGYELGITVVAEGVERPEERDVLLTDGVELLQGYLFARPQPGFPAPSLS